MPAATRSVAVELHEHAEAITSWRDGCQSDKATAHSPAIGHKTLASLSAHGNGRCPHKTYGATPGKRGLVSVPARRHCRRVSRAALATYSGRSYNSHQLAQLHQGQFLQASGGVGTKVGDLRPPLVLRYSSV